MTSTDEKVMSVWSHVLTYCQAKKIVRPDADWADALAAIVIGIAPLFYLTIKSWTNGALLVLLVLLAPKGLIGLFRRRTEGAE